MLERGIEQREWIRHAAVDGKGATTARRPTGSSVVHFSGEGGARGARGCKRERTESSAALQGKRSRERKRSDAGVGGGHGNEGMG